MAEPRRLLMTCDTVGGVWCYALELARALAPSGVEVVLAAMGGPLSRAQSEEAARAPNVALFARVCKLEWMEEPWADVAAAGEWLLRVAEYVCPDVVHLNDYAHGALPWPAPVMMVGHSDVLSWFRAVRAEEAPPSWDRYRAAVGRGLRAADQVVAPTAAMLSSLAADYGPLRRATVIANARDAASFLPGEKEPMVLAAGRLWDDAKNLAALDAAAARVCWPVVVAGATEHPDGGVREGRHVGTLGVRTADELAALYAAAAIYALPAKYEPFGLSVLEAALAGCALVLGDIPSLRESWDGVAIFVPPDDSGALADAIERLAASPAIRAQAAGAARRRALAFAPARMAAAYLEGYRALVEAAPPAEVECA
ncbi:MAG: glycosyl transferase family 1 [Myxococcales bacterium]|nr:glycosyl transferase family 1 [Myxococcales bacterium]